MTEPGLTNNPGFDVIVTNKRPLLSFFNAAGGEGKRTYKIQIDKVPTFDSPYLIEYENIPEENQYVTGKLVETDLDDNILYYWRAKAVDEKLNEGEWEDSRFFLDTSSDDAFMNLTRIPIESIEVSSGYNKKNIIDIDDPGQMTFWQSTPPGDSVQWVEFDTGKICTLSRVWILSGPESPSGWLKDFLWQKSDDGENWQDIEGGEIEDNDTFRNIIDFSPVEGRYFRLLIKSWHGYAPQINETILYSPGRPPVPKTPEGDYVLIIGNERNGFTFTELADFVESLPMNLKTLVVPHYEVSLEMIESFENKPVAIILSGNNTDYPNLPMFEYNGEFEIIRECNIPILGICCGHQLTVMAYGYTYARSMGWSDITELEDIKDRTEIEIKKDDPVFEGMGKTFIAPEIHGWAVVKLPENYEMIAESGYIQALKSNSKMLYGEQFHAEIKVPYNEGGPYLENFLKMALKEKEK